MNFNLKRREREGVKKEVLVASPKRPALKAQELAQKMARLALDKKVHDLTILDVRGLASYADFILIASARSARHVQGVAEAIEEELYQERIEPLGIEGKTEGHWVLMDYGDVVLHLFFEPVREVYDLEGLWMDAPRIDLEEWGLSPEPSVETDEEY
ncbi:MAG TPA: ribosome silencing factor [Thermodesulfatator atlanticus]|uniref:Ribosomal silencing factor RsfS n=1 Tax=Thermodesulfatator atlanticus TaxID=501497 RepID=A0A7V5NXW4_9BACT|nr:ribosome silencing factor [Thermodesulfatator atlanticus]